MAMNPNFPFDLEALGAMFKSDDMSKMLGGFKMPEIDAAGLFAAQQKNMNALVETNKKIAASYQALFRKQVQVIEQAVADAQGNLARAGKIGDSPQSGGDAIKAAFEKAAANLTEIAEGAREANSAAYKVIADHVQQSMAELQSLSAKFKA